MRPNRVKRLLQENRPAVGTWLSLGSPLAAEQLAHQGWDWLNVEQEHAAIDATLTLSLLQAISTTDTVPLVRVPWDEPAHIKRALDAGAYGVVVPMVKTVEDAQIAVRASRYPPQGDRSVGGVRPRLYGGPDYVQHANEEILVIVQIEHYEGVRNVRDILSVPGVDAWFVGPNDLCASLGLPPSYDAEFPQFTEALDTLLKAGKDLGVPGGIHVSSPEAALRRIEQGYRFISVQSDANFMAAAASSTIEAVRAGVT